MSWGLVTGGATGNLGKGRHHSRDHRRRRPPGVQSIATVGEAGDVAVDVGLPRHTNTTAPGDERVGGAETRGAKVTAKNPFQGMPARKANGRVGGHPSHKSSSLTRIGL